jgi:hypothetical protein
VSHVNRQGFCRHGPGCRFKHIKLGAEDCPPEADLTLVQQQGAVSIEQQQQQQQPASTAVARAGGAGSSNSATAAAGSSSTSSSSAAKQQQQQQQQQHTRGPRGGAKRRGDAPPRAPPVIGQVRAASHAVPLAGRLSLSLKLLVHGIAVEHQYCWYCQSTHTAQRLFIKRLLLVLHVSASSVFASMLICCQCCVWFVQLSEAEMSSMERSMPFSKDAVARYFLVKSPNYEVGSSSTITLS